MADKRFQPLSEEQIAQKRQSVQNKNTLKSEKIAANRFLLYLKATNVEVPEDWMHFEAKKID